MKTIQELKKENALLRKKLEVAKLWMSKEVKNQIWSIENSWSSENLEDTIQNKIENFFSGIILINLPTSVIQNIITSEISYHHMIEDWENIDGMSVIIWYHKALDALIEKHITKDFRKFVKKLWQDTPSKNDPLEKSIYSVVHSWHILSIWRLYHTLKTIQKSENTHEYVESFKKYLDKYTEIKDILMSDKFISKMDTLIQTEVLWKKRHTWRVSRDETKKVRDLLIWDFEDKWCIIYSLIETSKLEF